VAYALLVADLDGKEREKFDRELNGYADKDARALAALFGAPTPGTEGA
jgi:hypothetical protein